VAEGMLLLVFSGLRRQKNQISRRALAPVETFLVYNIRIKKRYLAPVLFNLGEIENHVLEDHHQREHTGTPVKPGGGPGCNPGLPQATGGLS
jgi:hypothetical protein